MDDPSVASDPQASKGEIDRLRQAMRQYAGPEDSPPIRVIRTLLDLTESMRETQSQLTARMTEAALEDVVRRAARRGIDKAATEVARGQRWRRYAAATAGGATLLCAGALGGFQAGMEVQDHEMAWTATELQQAFRRGADGAHWLATVAASNDLAQPAAWCAERTHQILDQGGTACYVPLWIKAPPATTP